jgi:hypothetical protein
MGHGFLIYVTNPTPIVEEIRLFKGSVPSGLTIHTMDDRYDFEQLQQAAKSNPFKGNVLTTDSDKEILIEIINNGHVEKIMLHGRYEGADMIVDGQHHHIKVWCPANSTFYIRLHTL